MIKKVGLRLMIGGISLSFSIWTISQYGLKSGIFSLGIVAAFLGLMILILAKGFTTKWLKSK